MKTRSGPRRARWISVTLVALVLLSGLAAAAPAYAYTISGTVTSAANSQPVFDAELQLWKWSTESQSWVRPGFYTGSGIDGSYSFNFSDDGTYTVQCYNTDGFAEQWWNAVPTQGLASSIVVPGGTLTDIDFVLWAAKAETDLTLDAPTTCAYKSATLTGSLTSDTTGLAGKKVTIKYWTATGWKAAGSDTTDAAGLYTLHVTPAKATTYQAVFAEDATYAGTTSPTASVLPRVYLTKPAGPATARTSTTFTSALYLKPRHTAGTRPVSIECQRYESGKWVTKKSVKAKAANYSTYTKCTARVQLGLKGSWRIRAVHAEDAQNAKTTTSWRTIKVS